MMDSSHFYFHEKVDLGIKHALAGGLYVLYGHETADGTRVKLCSVNASAIQRFLKVMLCAFCLNRERLMRPPVEQGLSLFNLFFSSPNDDWS